MRVVQFKALDGTRQVGIVSKDGESLHVVDGDSRVYYLAQEAHQKGISLEKLIESRTGIDLVDYGQVVASNRLLVPFDHPDPAHCILSGTGLDHLGSAQARDSMHAKLSIADGDAELTDSMKMFKLGLEGGKPAPGKIGSQPEWFYKGDGDWLVHPGHGISLPTYALDGGEEPEMVGIYMIGDNGEVLRIGFALGNEYSDHVLEKQNYLYLAHSKLRQSSFGPELLLGDPPDNIVGTSRILRDDKEIWSGEFLTGEANMTHTISNIEHHHFKYRSFRRAGDVHCHFYGTATLSFAAGITVQPNDVFEISAPAFGRPLRNQLLATDGEDLLVETKTL